jgi:hypothetical protein
MQVVWQVEPALRHLEFAMDVKPTIADGMDKMRYQRYSALVVDCAAADLVQMRDNREQWLKHDPMVIAVAARSARNSDAVTDVDADAVWTLPLLPAEMHRTLLQVRAKELGDRRLHRRFKPARATTLRYSYDGQSYFEAMVRDITETGVAIEAMEPLTAGRALHIQFKLPAMLSPIQSLADVVWRNDRGAAGLRFLQMPQQQHRQLERWLRQARMGMSSGYSYAG